MLLPAPRLLAELRACVCPRANARGQTQEIIKKPYILWAY